MSLLSSYDPSNRYRRRFLDRMKSFIGVVLSVALAFGLGFWLGGASSVQHIEFLQGQIEIAARQQEALEGALTETRAGAQTAMLRFEQLQESVAETIPEGPMTDLAELLKKQLEGGVDPKRLEFALRSLRPPQNCTEPQSQRFVISTPAYQGPESKVEIGDGLISIMGEGMSAYNSAGMAEAWYDPAKKVKVKFMLAGGRMEEKSGVFPIQKSIVVNDREYRFTVEAGSKSFAKVTYDSCDYP